MGAINKTAKVLAWIFKWLFRLAFTGMIALGIPVIVASASHLIKGNIKGGILGIGILIGLSVCTAIFYIAQRKLNRSKHGH